MKNIAILPVFIILFSLAFLSCPVVTNEDPDVKKVTAAEEELTLQTKTYDLSVYKKDAKANLTAYVETLNPDDYSYYNWKAIIDIADIGRENIDKAIDKQGVDTALAAAKEEIDMVSKEEKPTELAIVEEEVEIVELEEAGLSSARGWVITIKHLDENIIFNCTVDDGRFIQVPGYSIEGLHGKNVTVHSGDRFIWINRGEMGTDKDWFQHAFVEIVLTLEQNIIGYVILEFDMRFSDYFVNIIKSVIFPMLNGEYQNISEEYVKASIEKAKEESQTDAGRVAAVKKTLLHDAQDCINLSRTLGINLENYVNGVVISWTSSDYNVISNTGRIYRQCYDAVVILTATLTFGSVVDTKEFIFTVPALAIE